MLDLKHGRGSTFEEFEGVSAYGKARRCAVCRVRVALECAQDYDPLQVGVCLLLVASVLEAPNGPQFVAFFNLRMGVGDHPHALALRLIASGSNFARSCAL